MPALVLLPGPGAEVARLAEGPQVRSDLDQDRAGAAEIDPRNRLQPPQGTLVVGHFGLDACVQRGEGGVGPVDGRHLHLQREQRERVERGGQGLGQRLQLGLRPNWQMRANHRLSLVSVFLPRICRTCSAWCRSAWMPASSSASNGACQ